MALDSVPYTLLVLLGLRLKSIVHEVLVNQNLGVKGIVLLEILDGYSAVVIVRVGAVGDARGHANLLLVVRHV